MKRTSSSMATGPKNSQPTPTTGTTKRMIPQSSQRTPQHTHQKVTSQQSTGKGPVLGSSTGRNTIKAPSVARDARLNQESFNQVFRTTLTAPSKLPGRKHANTSAMEDQQEPDELGIRQRSRLAPPDVPPFMQTRLEFTNPGDNSDDEPVPDDEFLQDVYVAKEGDISNVRDNTMDFTSVTSIIRSAVNNSINSIPSMIEDPDSSDLPRNHFYKVEKNYQLDISSRLNEESDEHVKSILINSRTKSDPIKFETTVTDKLIDQFFHEQLIEHGIKTDEQRDVNDLLRFETHCIMDTPVEESILKMKELLDKEEETRRVSNLDQERGKSLNKAMSMIQTKTLEAEISFIENLIGCHTEEQLSVESSIRRVKDAISLTKQLIENQHKREKNIQEISLVVENEVNGGKESQSIVDPLMEQNTNSTISFNIYKIRESAANSSEKLIKQTKEIDILEEQIRKETIERIHHTEMMKQKLEFNRKWIQDAKQLENKALRDLELARHETLKLKRQYDYGQKLSHYVEKEEGLELVKTLERVVRMLKGKEEMPNGTYISVSRALDMYSQLRETAHRNTFTIQYFKKFLKDHREFGIFIDDIEPLLNLYDDTEDELALNTSEEDEEEDTFLLDRVELKHHLQKRELVKKVEEADTKESSECILSTEVLDDRDVCIANRTAAESKVTGSVHSSRHPIKKVNR